MAPGIRPGDVVASGWFPATGRWRRPARWERWVLLTDEGLPIVKRVVGLPGEQVTISAGDLVVDGTVPLKPPAVLAELAAAVPLDERAPAGGPADAPSRDAGPLDAPQGQTWRLAPMIVWDDVAIEPALPRRLEPVRDVGMAAVVRATLAGGGGGPHVRLTVGPQEFRMPITAGGRFAVVAGRLDGHAVAAMWRLGRTGGAAARSPLPAEAPARWDVAVPWTHAESGAEVAPPADHCSPVLAIALEPAATGGDCVIERVTVWRDVHYRPLVPGADGWRLGTAAWLVLGDFPDASIDSRRFGPVDRAALRHRVHPVR